MYRTLALLLLLCCVSTATASRRNVLLLIADDHGLELGCYGHPVIRTPNLDQLAARGVRFTHGFATVASCSASRSVILTGMFNHTNGQYGHAHSYHNLHTHSHIRTLPRLLKDAGYRTAIVSKFHVKPTSLYPFDAQLNPADRGGRNVIDMAHLARRFIEADTDRPFFVVMGYVDPHRAKVGFGNGQYPGVESIKYKPEDMIVPPFLPDSPETRQELAEYAESVGRLDQGVGEILKVIEDTDHNDDTLIIYLSDNGIAFPGAKTTLYEPGLHLPLLISSSKHKRSVVNNAMVSWVDIAPTILDWANVPVPKTIAGRSVLPILDQENPQGWDTIFGSHTFHEITMYYPMRMIRTRRYKYILNLAHQLPYPFASDLYASPTWQGVLKRGDEMFGKRKVDAYINRPREELYDLENDPNEAKNLAPDPAMANVLTDLRKRLKQWQENTKDPWIVKYEYE